MERLVDSNPQTLRRSVSAEPADFCYDGVFWMAYAANTMLVTANALTFRFAELVAWLGGSEARAGIIVSMGVGGALLARLFIGRAIDQFGTRLVWGISAAFFVTGCAGFFPNQVLGFRIVAARVLFAGGLAGMFTCSLVHIQNRAPESRRTEVIGTLGSSGFLGMILGTRAGDLIFGNFAPPDHFYILFGLSCALGIGYLLLVLFFTRGDQHTSGVESCSSAYLIKTYWPGWVLVVAFTMGATFVIPSVFLTRFVTWRGLSGIGTFWTVYAIAAFVFRIASRKWSQSVGRHKLLVYGLCGVAIGHALLTQVNSDYGFIVPAICCGFGHALLFPAIISLGAGAFPRNYRGIGTSMALGFVELGQATAAPVFGQLIDRFNNGHGFKELFMCSAVATALIAVIYWFRQIGNPDTGEIA